MGQCAAHWLVPRLLATAGHLTQPADLACYLVYLPERAQQPRIARFRDWLMDEAAADRADG